MILNKKNNQKKILNKKIIEWRKIQCTKTIIKDK